MSKKKDIEEKQEVVWGNSGVQITCMLVLQCDTELLYYLPHMKTGVLFRKPNISELRRSLLRVSLWGFSTTFINVSQDGEREVPDQLAEDIFTMALRSPCHLQTRNIAHHQKSPTHVTSSFQFCTYRHFKVKTKSFQLPILARILCSLFTSSL